MSDLYDECPDGIYHPLDCLDEFQVIDDCKNLDESYGVICVKCNKCGRFNKEKK